MATYTSQYPTEYSHDTVKVTSYNTSTDGEGVEYYASYYTVDPNTSLTGWFGYNCYASANYQITNQKHTKNTS